MGPARPRLRTDIRAEIVSDHEVLVMSGADRYIFDSAATVACLPLLDGTREVADIATELSDRFAPRQIARAIASLVVPGLVVDGPVVGTQDETAWLDALGTGSAEGLSALSGARVRVHGFGDVDTGPLLAALASRNITVVVDSTATIDVALCDDYLNDDLDAFNRSALADGRPWLLASPVRAELWLGPLFEPGATGCWECLRQRLAGNRQMERYLQRVRGAEYDLSMVPASTPAVALAAASMLTTEVERFAVGAVHHPGLLGRLVTLDLLTWESETHVLVRQPQCRACGDASIATNDSPIELSKQAKVDGVDSGHRVIPPAETIARLEHHVSPILGAITRLHRFEEGDSEVSHNWSAGHNFAMMSNSTYLLRKNIRGLSGGKGRSDVQAKASAMCEALERYSGVWRGDEHVRRASASELGADALDFDELLGFSDHQYENRVEWNSHQTSGIHLVPFRLDADRKVDWTSVWSLTESKPAWVPTSYCYFGHPDAFEDPFCFSDANGNAAGNTLEEAILQGLLELVERDSVALWWYNRLRVPGVELETIDDPYIEQLKRFYTSMGRSLQLLDVTFDLGIPSFVAMSHRFDHPVQDPLIGFGSHVEPRLGALRALTECNQFLPSVSQRDAAGATRYLFDDPEMLDWFTTATTSSESYLVPDPQRPTVDISKMDGLTSDDISEEIRLCVEVLRSRGLEVFVLDQSRPDLDVKVAKVIVPNLRHFWRRLGKGRLYNVPVELGLLRDAVDEAALNPRSIFF
tara:strand:- start:7408 stop:9669 length:2262 start_codon:yes stop_codon:yes gene_type:complete